MHTDTQFDLFGGSEPIKKLARKRTKRVKVNSPETAIKLVNGEATVSRNDRGIVVHYHNAIDKLPDDMMFMNSEYDGKTDDLTMEWSNENLLAFWDGMLTEHLKQLRKTKPGSASRADILKWQESDAFNDICSAISFEPDDIRNGVIEAMKNYDSLSNYQSIATMLFNLDTGVIGFVEQLGLSRRECNSRRLKNCITDAFLAELRKAKSGSKKSENIIKKLNSRDLRDLSSQIGIDVSTIINGVKDKMYFIQNPSEDEYDI